MILGENGTLLVASVLVANIGSIIGSHFSIKITVAELKTLVGVLSKEVEILRKRIEKQNERDSKC